MRMSPANIELEPRSITTAGSVTAPLESRTIEATALRITSTLAPGVK